MLLVWLFVASGRVSVVIDCSVEYFASFPTDGSEVHNVQLHYASNARCRLFKFPRIARQAIKFDKYMYFLIDPHARLNPTCRQLRPQNIRYFKYCTIVRAESSLYSVLTWRYFQHFTF